MSHLKSDSLRRQLQSKLAMRELICTECGITFIGNGSCPSCNGVSKSVAGGEDMLRKTFDAPDLKKGF